MPYEARKDPYHPQRSFMTRGRGHSVVTASPSEFDVYPKALKIIVPTGTASPSISVIASLVSDTPDAMSLPEGITILSDVCYRGVTAISAGVTVYRIDD